MSLLKLIASVETKITEKKETAILTRIVFIIFDFRKIELNIIDTEIVAIYDKNVEILKL